mgnify:CR=1 FL=1
MPNATQSTNNSNLFKTLFVDHPASVDETYFGHMRFALGFGFWLGVAALAAFAHALIPAVCETTASRILKRLHAKIETRH